VFDYQSNRGSEARLQIGCRLEDDCGGKGNPTIDKDGNSYNCLKWSGSGLEGN
jgi:hypothetical protein